MLVVPVKIIQLTCLQSFLGNQSTNITLMTAAKFRSLTLNQQPTHKCIYTSLLEHMVPHSYSTFNR